MDTDIHGGHIDSTRKVPYVRKTPLAYNFHVFVDFWFVGAKYVATASTVHDACDERWILSPRGMRSMACTDSGAEI